MEWNKINIKRLLLVITFTVVLFWALNHLNVVGGVLGTIYAVVFPFILGLCFAFAINVLLRPLERGWSRLGGKREPESRKWKLKLKRPVCLLSSTVIVAGVIFILFFIIVPQFKQAGVSIAERFPQYMAQIETWWSDLTNWLGQYGIALPALNFDLAEWQERIITFLSERGHAFLDKTMDITVSIFSGVFNVILGLVFAFYVLAQKEKLGEQLKKLMYAVTSEKKVESFLETANVINRIFTKFITGQLFEAVIIGALCFVGMTIFRMPYAPVIATMVGFTALIPVFGAFIGTAVGAFFILMENPLQALWFIVFIVVLQQVEGNFIYPKVVGKSVGLPGIWVLAAVTVGGGLFGIVGILLGVPVCSSIYFLGRQAINKRLAKKGMEPMEE